LNPLLLNVRGCADHPDIRHSDGSITVRKPSGSGSSSLRCLQALSRGVKIRNSPHYDDDCDCKERPGYDSDENERLMRHLSKFLNYHSTIGSQRLSQGSAETGSTASAFV
jgi:hypothetical protein